MGPLCLWQCFTLGFSFVMLYDDVKMSLKVALLLAVQGVEDPNGQNEMMMKISCSVIF